MEDSQRILGTHWLPTHRQRLIEGFVLTTIDTPGSNRGPAWTREKMPRTSTNKHLINREYCSPRVFAEHNYDGPLTLRNPPRTLLGDEHQLRVGSSQPAVKKAAIQP